PGGTGSADGQDTFIVNQLQSMASTRPLMVPDHGATTRRDTLDLDGQAGGDTYTINTTGSQSATPSDYVIDVLDTAPANAGADTLAINGTAARDDMFLLRTANYLVGRPNAQSPAFVALLHGNYDKATLQVTLQPPVERINYDGQINDTSGGLTVNGSGGDDY